MSDKYFVVDSGDCNYFMGIGICALQLDGDFDHLFWQYDGFVICIFDLDVIDISDDRKVVFGKNLLDGYV